MYRNRAVLKRLLTQWVQVKSFTNVTAAARNTQQVKILEDMFVVVNVNVINIKINSQEQVYYLHVFIDIKGKITEIIKSTSNVIDLELL